MSNSPLTHYVAMDLNGTGTLVDVSTYVHGPDGIQKTATRTDQFRDAGAATYTFSLDNYDGRFTPGNVLGNGTGTYANPPTERMTVNWSISNGTQTRYFAGSILTMTPTDDNWARIVITCDDMLGAASRNTPSQSLASAAVMGSSPYLYWPLTDPTGSVQALETSGNNGPPLAPLFSAPNTAFVLGSAGVPACGGETQLEIISSTTAPSDFGYGGQGTSPGFVTPAYPAGSLGFVGFWVTQGSLSSQWAVTLGWTGAGLQTLQILQAGNLIRAKYNDSSGGTTAAQVNLAPVAPVYVAAGVTWTLAVSTYTITTKLYVNGVLQDTQSSTTLVVPPTKVSSVDLAGTTSFADTAFFSHFSHTPTLVHEELAGVTTEANRLALIDQTTPIITLAALPAALSTAPVGLAATSGQSVLDMLNAEMRTEQGYIDCVTSGTLTAPVQKIRIRERTRSATVAYTFDSQTELLKAPSFIRDPTNLIWSDTITSPAGPTTVSQTALQTRAGFNTASDTIDNAYVLDVNAWGGDRLYRGSNQSLRPIAVLIDNVKCPTDRSADLLAMVPGDRIRITNIPSTVLGFTTWDGWLLDKDELHTSSDTDVQNLFTLYLQPCPAVPDLILGTDRWGCGTNHPLATAITTTSATSISISSVDTITLMETVSVPYDIVIDAERMTITACNSATPQVATVTRGVGGTIAATHSAGALLEIFQAKRIGL